MIFKDKLQEKGSILRPEFDRLLKLALKNQQHHGDLLLFHVNGFYDQSILQFKDGQGKTLNPHVVGLGFEGYSELTHYDFIHKYRTSFISKQTLPEYLDKIKMEIWDAEKSKKNDKLIGEEATTIQLEMLIYLKFWEADMIIKKLYQFVRLLNGEPYDWYFKISESSRDKDSTGSRQDIIRKSVRDRLQSISPILYDTIKSTYITQLRNSIAHSNYSIMGRHIQPNNFIKNDVASQMKSLSFDQWIDIFHNVIVLHNEYIRMNEEINNKYASIAIQQDNIYVIQVTEKDRKQYELPLRYRPKFKDWGYDRGN